MTELANKKYIKARDKLIPIAERYANARHNGYLHEAWGRTFILKMDRLAVEAGIQERHYHRQSSAIIRSENEM